MAVTTISRQYGSGGDEITPRVCELLGYRFFDKRMMAWQASQAGLTEDEIVDFWVDSYKRDKAAADYLNRFYGVDWSDPMLYDLVINTRKWGIESAAHLIVNAISLLPAEPSDHV